MNRTYKYLLLYELHRIIYDVDLHFHIRQNQNKETSQEQCPVVDNSNKKYVFIHDLNWSDIKQAWKKARYPHIDTEKIEWNNVLEQKSTCTYVNETIWRTINVPWILIIWTFTFYKKFITHSTFIVDGNYLVYYEILFIWYVFIWFLLRFSFCENIQICPMNDLSNLWPFWLHKEKFLFEWKNIIRSHVKVS